MNDTNHAVRRPFWSTWSGVCAILLGAALLFFLVTEHTAHLFGALPYLILLACPLMHIFMHHGHGGHGGHGAETNGTTNNDSAQDAAGHHH